MLANQEIMHNIAQLGANLGTNLGVKKDSRKKAADMVLRDHVPMDRQRWLRKQRNLSASDKVDIAHKVFCQHHSQKDVAKEY